MVVLLRFEGYLNPNQTETKSVNIFKYNQNFRQFIVRVMSNFQFTIEVRLKRNNTTIKQFNTQRIANRPTTTIYFLNTGDFDEIEIRLRNNDTQVRIFHFILEAYENL